MSDQLRFSYFRIDLYVGTHHEVHTVTENPFFIGRDYEADLLIYDKSISRKHLKVELNDFGQVTVTDCNSANGTVVDTQDLTGGGEVKYQAGQKIQLGNNQIFLFLEVLDARDPFAMHPNPAAEDGAMKRISGMVQSKGRILAQARAKAESLIVNGSAIKQKVAKEALQTAEEKITEATAEAKRLADEAQRDAEIIIQEGQRLAEEFRTHAQEQASRQIEEAERRATERERAAQALEEETKVKLYEETERLEQLRKKTESEKSSLSSEINRLKTEEERCSALEASARQSLKEIESKLVQKREAYETLAQSEERLAQTLRASQLELDRHRDETSTLRVEFERYSSEREALKRQVEDLRKEIHTHQDQALAAEKIVTQAQAKALEAQKVCSECEDELSRLHSDLAQAERKLADAVMAQKTLIAETEKLKLEAEQFCLKQKEEAHELKKQVSEELLLRRELAEKNLKEKLSRLEKRSQKTQRRVIKVLYKRGTAQAEAMREEARDLIAAEREKSLVDIKSLRESATKESQALLAEAKSFHDDARTKAQSLYDEKVKEATEATRGMVDRAEEAAQLKKSEAKEVFQLAETKALETVKGAKRTAEEILRNAEIEAKEKKHEASRNFEEEIRTKKSEWQVEYKALQEKMKKELASATKDLEESLAKQKASALEELDAELAKRKEFSDREKRVQLHALSQEIELLWGSRLKPFIDFEKVERQGANLTEEMRKAVHSALFSDDLTDEQKQKLYGVDPTERHEQLKRYWMRTAGVAVAVALVAILVPLFRVEITQKAKDIVKENESASDSYVSEMSEAWKNRPKFEPEQTPEYRETYVDRVVYMEGYVEGELEGVYREKWIVDLNEFVIDELRLSENAIIPFISKEVNLVKDLAEKKEKINPDFAEDGVERLRERELEFLAEVKDLLKTPENFKKVQAFKKKHYLEYFNSAERGLANSESSESTDSED